MARENNYISTTVKCEVCGYANLKHNVDLYGTCRGCGKVLDPKAKYKYEMYCRLKLWRNKKWKLKQED